MFAFRHLLLCTLAVLFGIAIAAASSIDASTLSDKRYSCQNQAVHIDPLEPVAFAET